VAWPPEPSDDSVPSVRVLYPDLHGVARGKNLPTGAFERTIEPRRSPSIINRRQSRHINLLQSFHLGLHTGVVLIYALGFFLAALFDKCIVFAR
jgi:hypothetical protein